MKKPKTITKIFRVFNEDDSPNRCTCDGKYMSFAQLLPGDIMTWNKVQYQVLQGPHKHEKSDNLIIQVIEY